MPVTPEILELENRGYSQNGEPVLIEAYRLLKKQWQKGDRDRELGLHLLFLSWYGLIEPPFVFGEYDEKIDKLQETFHDVFRYFEPRLDEDVELLYVIGLPAHMFPFILGDERTWEIRAAQYRETYRPSPA